MSEVHRGLNFGVEFLLVVPIAKVVGRSRVYDS